MILLCSVVSLERLPIGLNTRYEVRNVLRFQAGLTGFMRLVGETATHCRRDGKMEFHFARVLT